MSWIIGIACFFAGAVFGFAVMACLVAARRYDDWEDRR